MADVLPAPILPAPFPPPATRDLTLTAQPITPTAAPTGLAIALWRTAAFAAIAAGAWVALVGRLMPTAAIALRVLLVRRGAGPRRLRRA